MNPVPKDKDPSTTSGCSNIISSTCVSWQGADIECLTICPGDTLTEVVQAIGELACTALDVANYNTSQLDPPTPESFQEMLQSIIDQIHANTELINNFECDCDDYVLPEILLPECVFDYCPSCLPDPYPLDQAVTLIGNAVCDAISELKNDVNDLNNAITAVGNANSSSIGQLRVDLFDQLAADTASIEANTLVTVAAHELTGPVAGQTVPVNQSVEYFADRMFDYTNAMGSVQDMNNAVALEDANLKNQVQLNSAVGDLMLQATGWASSPTKMADAVSNIWITLQDLRAAYVAEHSVEEIPCALLQPKNASIVSTTTSTARIQWEFHGQNTIQDEIEFQVNIYDYDPVTRTACGPSLAYGQIDRNVSNPIHTLDVNTSGLNPNKDYIVDIIAIYPCGASESTQIVGKVVSCTQTMIVNVESRTGQTIPEVCNQVPYNRLTRDMRVVLYDNANNVINNNTGEDITIRLRYRVVNPLIANDVYEEYDFVISTNNSSSAWVEYTSYDQVFYQGSCQDIDRAENDQAVEILDPTECFIVSGNVTFIP